MLLLLLPLLLLLAGSGFIYIASTITLWLCAIFFAHVQVAWLVVVVNWLWWIIVMQFDILLVTYCYCTCTCSSMLQSVKNGTLRVRSVPLLWRWCLRACFRCLSSQFIQFKLWCVWPMHVCCIIYILLYNILYTYIKHIA